MKGHIIILLLLTLLAVNAYAAPVNLGTASTFGLLAGSAITNVGSSVINGNVGIWPGTSVTGFPPGTINGTLYNDDSTAQQAESDLTTAYNAAAGAASTGSLPGTVGTLTLGPGVYTFSSAALLTGALTLQGNGDPNAQWIFQIPSALTTVTGSSVALTNGAMGCQVFWQVGSSATIADSVFAGNIMALSSITLGGGTLNGDALARNAAVTITTAETVNAGPCTPAVPEASTVVLAMTGIPAALLFRRRR